MLGTGDPLSMNADRLHALYQFALAVAGVAEDWRQRELGPIHLLKYAYLADLEWARTHGETWTGVDWRFYHFGPWAAEAWKEVEPAIRSIGAEERRIDYPQAEDDVVRFRVADDHLARSLASQIPVQLRLLLKREVHRYASDTSALLHHVYLTGPMLAAAPNEALDFTTALAEARPSEERVGDQRASLSVKQRRRRKEAIQEFGKSLRERLAARAEASAARSGQPPRYDDVFHEGVAWLDDLAGDPVPEGQLDGRLDEGIWHSPTRKASDVP